MKKLVSTLSLAVMATFPMGAGAQEMPEALLQATRQAVAANPDVQARWHVFTGAEADQDFARAAYRPTVDLVAGVGREKRKSPGTPSNSYTRSGVEASLTQMLYDGWFTPNEVERLGHARVTRYYELLETMEETALEVVRAYSDLLRYRQLVELAKANYVEHKLLHDQISERVKAGVSRGVDFEQATGRLALAESNLLTEASNLHDVTARYLRIIGVQPDPQLPSLDARHLAGGVPLDSESAIKAALSDNYQLKASIANIMSRTVEVDSQKAGYRPRLDLRASEGHFRNLDGVDGRSRERVIELVLSYNLYRGGADDARLQAAAEELNRSKDLREKACRDARQTLAIAWNDVQRLREQLAYLDQHQLSTEKSREAYRQQFDIGQRTLLDLLDTENEYFEARRAYVNATHDQIVAQARSLASMGQLLKTMGVVREDLPTVSDLGQNEDEYKADPETMCPPETPTMLKVDKDALLADAMRTGRKR